MRLGTALTRAGDPHEARTPPRPGTARMNSIGPESYVRERVAAFREAGVTVLNVTPIGGDPVRLLEQVKEMID